MKGWLPSDILRAVAQWLERHSYKVQVGGSIPPGTTRYASVAQQLERGDPVTSGRGEVGGANPP